MRAQARGAAVVTLQEPGPGPGQAEQAERVSGGRGIEHDVIERFAAGRQQADELVEGGNLRRAGAGELFAYRGALGIGGIRCRAAPEPLPIGFRRDFWIDVHGRQAGRARHRPRRVRQRRGEHLVEVRGRVGADEKDRFAAIREDEGRDEASVVFPTPPLPVKKRQWRVGAARSPSAILDAMSSLRAWRPKDREGRTRPVTPCASARQVPFDGAQAAPPRGRDSPRCAPVAGM